MCGNMAVLCVDAMIVFFNHLLNLLNDDLRIGLSKFNSDFNVKVYSVDTDDSEYSLPIRGDAVLAASPSGTATTL